MQNQSSLGTSKSKEREGKKKSPSGDILNCPNKHGNRFCDCGFVSRNLLSHLFGHQSMSRNGEGFTIAAALFFSCIIVIAKEGRGKKEISPIITLRSSSFGRFVTTVFSKEVKTRLRDTDRAG